MATWPGLGYFAPRRHGGYSYADVETQSVTHASTLHGGSRIARTYRAAGLTLTPVPDGVGQQSAGTI